MAARMVAVTDFQGLLSGEGRVWDPGEHCWGSVQIAIDTKLSMQAH